jgi:CheY-like chemotaxis protein
MLSLDNEERASHEGEDDSMLTPDPHPVDMRPLMPPSLVLVVDDHPTNLALLSHQVQALGYAAECAQNGNEALALWQTARFTMIITDCNMPEISGYDLTRHIRTLEAQRQLPRTPIIACTANAMGREAEVSRAAGMDDHLIKPVQLSDLLGCLNRWAGPVARPAGNLPQQALLTTPARPATLPPPVMDRSVLAAFSEGDAEMERCVLSDFRRVNDGDAAVLRQAVSDNDPARVRSTAHRMKGANRMVGAMALAEVCERIHQASAGASAEAVHSHMPAFEREIQRLNASLDS